MYACAHTCVGASACVCTAHACVRVCVYMHVRACARKRGCACVYGKCVHTWEPYLCRAYLCKGVAYILVAVKPIVVDVP